MSSFQRIIYHPTLRCNCNCKSCGQSRFFTEKECDGKLILQRLIESNYHLGGGLFSITGGEPFLKQDLPEMLSDIVNMGNNPLDITTNGICTEAIKTFIDRVHDLSKVSFAVSIDGMPEIHNTIRGNPQAFEKAIQTVKLLKENGVKVQVNTVMGPDNYRDLDSFADFLSEQAGSQVPIAFIPNHVSYNKTDEFPYSSDEIKTIFPYIFDDINFEYLRTRGKAKITNCHAGQKTIAISPSGKIYACCTGFAFMGDEQREKYLIGDLKQQSLDEIAEIAADEHAGYRAAVKSCDGCWGNCEVGHEIQFWGMRIDDQPLNDFRKEMVKQTSMVKYNVENDIVFTKRSDGTRYFVYGAAPIEHKGDWSWSLGRSGLMCLDMGKTIENLTAIMQFKWVFAGVQRMIIKSCGRLLYDGVVKNNDPQIYFSIPEECFDDGKLLLDFEYPDACSPASRNESTDNRILAVAYYKIQFTQSGVPTKDGRDIPQYDLGQAITFTEENDGRQYFESGISGIETDFAWSVGTSGKMQLYIDGITGGLVAEFMFKRIYVPPQRFIVRHRDEVLYDAVVTSTEEPVIFVIPSSCIEYGRLSLDLEYTDAVSPASRGESTDRRELAFSFYSIRFDEERGNTNTVAGKYF